MFAAEADINNFRSTIRWKWERIEHGMHGHDLIA